MLTSVEVAILSQGRTTLLDGALLPWGALGGTWLGFAAFFLGRPSLGGVSVDSRPRLGVTKETNCSRFASAWILLPNLERWMNSGPSLSGPLLQVG